MFGFHSVQCHISASTVTLNCKNIETRAKMVSSGVSVIALYLLCTCSAGTSYSFVGTQKPCGSKKEDKLVVSDTPRNRKFLRTMSDFVWSCECGEFSIAIMATAWLEFVGWT